MQQSQRVLTALVFATVIAVPAAAQVDAGNQAAAAKASVSDVFHMGTQIPVKPASSALTRSTLAVSVSVNTSGLTPGNAYTLWLVVFNQPQHCASVPCSAADIPNPAVQASVFWGTGRVADEWGQAVFTAHAVPGAPEGVLLFGPHLVNPLKAEVHTVVRNHGAVGANGSSLQDQLTMLNAGCIGPCVDVQAAIHLP